MTTATKCICANPTLLSTTHPFRAAVDPINQLLLPFFPLLPEDIIFAQVRVSRVIFFWCCHKAWPIPKGSPSRTMSLFLLPVGRGVATPQQSSFAGPPVRAYDP